MSRVSVRLSSFDFQPELRPWAEAAFLDESASRLTETTCRWWQLGYLLQAINHSVFLFLFLFFYFSLPLSLLLAQLSLLWLRFSLCNLYINWYSIIRWEKYSYFSRYGIRATSWSFFFFLCFSCILLTAKRILCMANSNCTNFLTDFSLAFCCRTDDLPSSSYYIHPSENPSLIHVSPPLTASTIHS